MNKLIALSGPTFSGKSYLMSRIVNDFPELYVILFERFLHTGKEINIKYRSFYNDITKNLKTHNVISESNYSTENSILKYEYDHILNIICYPSFKDHQSNLNIYINKYGKDHLYHHRTCGFNLTILRENYNKKGLPKNNCVIYTLHNYIKIKEMIECFLKQ